MISTHSVGVSDCLHDGENGLLTKPGDVPALTEALHRVIEDYALRWRIVQAGLKECRQVYSWSAVGRQIMQVYARVASERPSTGLVDPLPYDPACRFRAEPHLL